MVEGTPLLREHAPKKCIEGSNPSLSANATRGWRFHILAVGEGWRNELGYQSVARPFANRNRCPPAVNPEPKPPEQVIAELAEALENERAFARRWWNALNQLRRAKEMPDECAKTSLGTAPEYDEYRRFVERTDAAAVGLTPEATYEVWDRENNRLSRSFRTVTEAEVARQQMSVEHPDAFVARVTRRFDYHFVDAKELDGPLRWCASGQNDDKVTVTIRETRRRAATVELSELLGDEQMLARFDSESLDRIRRAHHWRARH